MRLVLTIVAVLATWYFTFWMGGALLSLAGLPFWLAPLAALAASAAAGRATWTRSTGRPGLLRAAAKGAIIVGGIAFCAGFFGPIVLTPGANQGPLLGLFITGPLGFLLGGIGGGVRWAWQRRGLSANA